MICVSYSVNFFSFTTTKALNFVSEIDNWSFSVASSGILTVSMQEEADKVTEQMIPAERRKRTAWMRKILLLVLSITMVTLYIIIVTRQYNGFLLCQTLFVQMSDTYIPEIALYSSSLFDTKGFQQQYRKDARPVYLNTNETIELSYCDNGNAWVFAKTTSTDRCSDYLARSSETKTYDVTEVASLPWFTKSNMVIDWLFLSCHDCGENIDTCPIEFGQCMDNNNRCYCNPGRVGLNCEYDSSICDNIIQSGNGVSRNYTSPPNMEVANKQVFFTNDFQSLILYSGRRWIMYGLSPESSTIDVPKMEMLMTYFAANGTKLENEPVLDQLQIWGYQPYYFSSPMDYQTPTDSSEPIGVHWFQAKQDVSVNVGNNSDVGGVWRVDQESPVNFRFLCSKCSDKYPCQNNGVCSQDDHKCVCKVGFGGPQCQKILNCKETTCLNGGICNNTTGACDCGPIYHGNLCQFPTSSK